VLKSLIASFTWLVLLGTLSTVTVVFVLSGMSPEQRKDLFSYANKAKATALKEASGIKLPQGLPDDLDNLIPKGGEITIPAKWLEATSHTHAIYIYVRDNGQGFLIVTEGGEKRTDPIEVQIGENVLKRNETVKVLTVRQIKRGDDSKKEFNLWIELSEPGEPSTSSGGSYFFCDLLLGFRVSKNGIGIPLKDLEKLTNGTKGTKGDNPNTYLSIETPVFITTDRNSSWNNSKGYNFGKK
jgi:hypothetical protein